MRKVANILSHKLKTSFLEQKLQRELSFYNINYKPQHKFEMFLIDIGFPIIKLAIEVDGFKYHSTPEQKARDNYKDGRLRKKGWKIERFDGWFIYRHANVAAAKIALKYFKKAIETRRAKHARGVIAGFFGSRNRGITKVLIKQ